MAADAGKPQRLPIVVLSGSHLESDIQKVRQLGAADYFVKPPDFEEMVTMAKELRTRWLEGEATSLP